MKNHGLRVKKYPPPVTVRRRNARYPMVMALPSLSFSTFSRKNISKFQFDQVWWAEYYNYYFFRPFTEKSVKRQAIPKLLKLLKEQQNDTLRAVAKPPNNSNENFHELRDSSEDENS